MVEGSADHPVSTQRDDLPVPSQRCTVMSPSHTDGCWCESWTMNPWRWLCQRRCRPMLASSRWSLTTSAWAVVSVPVVVGAFASINTRSGYCIPGWVTLYILSRVDWKCRTGKWRTIFGVKSESGKCRTGKWRNKFGVKPEGGKSGLENGGPETAGPSTCEENAGIMSVISDRNAVKSKTVHKRLRSHSHYWKDTATGRHLPYGITVLPATRHNWTRPALTPASKLVLDLPTPEGWKAELA